MRALLIAPAAALAALGVLGLWFGMVLLREGGGRDALYRRHQRCMLACFFYVLTVLSLVHLPKGGDLKWLWPALIALPLVAFASRRAVATVAVGVTLVFGAYLLFTAAPLVLGTLEPGDDTPSGNAVNRTWVDFRGLSPATRTETEKTSPPPPRTLRVLVVDDNRDIVITMMALLRLEGHDTKACYNGSEVVGCVRDYDPDVVLLDIGLPGENGWEVARQIRANHPGSRPMLIAVTGEYTKAADKILAERSGFDYYVVKPADPKVLFALLEKARHPG